MSPKFAVQITFQQAITCLNAGETTWLGLQPLGGLIEDLEFMRVTKISGPYPCSVEADPDEEWHIHYQYPDGREYYFEVYRNSDYSLFSGGLYIQIEQTSPHQKTALPKPIIYRGSGCDSQ